MTRRISIVALAALVAIVVACTVTLGDGPRRVVASDLTSEVILPAYDDAVAGADTLHASVTAFVTAPTQATLDTMQAAWVAARIPWKQTDAFRFGPTAQQSLATAIDQFPVDPARIVAELEGTATLDAAYFSNLGANKKGYHGIEYLVFGTDDAVVLASFDARRLAFLAGCATDLAAKAHELRDSWRDYAATLADPGDDNAAFPTVKASIDALVNESVFQAEVIADARIGKPKGTASGGEPHPELQESAPSGTSIEDMTNALVSIRNVYFGSRDGTPGKGIGQLVAAQSTATDRNVRDGLAAAFTALAAIPTPYTQALIDKAPEIETAYTAMQELQHVLAAEVIATLGATLKFNDNDGD